mgnify:CR=1 FL=1
MKAASNIPLGPTFRLLTSDIPLMGKVAWGLAMRRVMYGGEWLQSHALHIHLLALPDFLGFDSIMGPGRVQQIGDDLAARIAR